jgi:hypothetical protein
MKVQVSTRKLGGIGGGIGGNSSLFSACSMTKWYMKLYFQKVLSWPDEFKFVLSIVSCSC